MTRSRGRLWLAIGIAGLVVATGCGRGNTVHDGAGVAGGASTTSAPVTAAVPTTTSPPPVTLGEIGALPDPVVVDGVPQARATPTRAPAGTRVRLEGYGFTGDPWQTAGGSLWLTATTARGGCAVFAEAENDVRVTPDGHLSGSFIVPSKGSCRFSTGESDTGPAGYDIAYQCTACRIGTFTVILPGESMEEPTGTRCDTTVNFGVQDSALEVYATGLTCADAESFLRAHAGPLRPVAGPAHVDVEGFSCDRTGQSAAALPPRANYTCTNGAQSIWFIRT
ncbi:MAG: hypothetical protein QOI56_1949 [Actinomycetota bacterium]|nr:hypothetical protein [Actinomycetota bacterium]